jgi:hypothetical protein
LKIKSWFDFKKEVLMKRKEIHFVIDREGNIHSTVKGVKGSSCSLVAGEFKGLGQVVGQEQTNEFYESGDGAKIWLDLQRKP